MTRGEPSGVIKNFLKKFFKKRNCFTFRPLYVVKPSFSVASFLVLLYEDDRRRDLPNPAWAAQHQQAWKAWLQAQVATGALRGGSALEITGNLIGKDGAISEGPYFRDDEMVGGFLILEAEDLSQATRLAAGYPVFKAGGYAEVRPFKKGG